MDNAFKVSTNRCFYIMIFLIALHQAFSDVSSLSAVYYSTIRLLVMALIMLCAGIQIAKIRNVSLKQFYVLGLLVLSFYTSYRVGSTWLIYLFLIFSFQKGKDLKLTVKIIIYVATTIFIVNFSIFLYQYFWGNRNILEYYVWGEKYLKRYFIYYNSPNGASRNLIFITVGWIYLMEEKMRMKHYVYLSIAAAIVFIFSRSDAVFIVPLIIVMSILFRYLKYGSDLLKIIRNIVFIIGIMISFMYVFFCQLGFDHPINFVDQFLTGRLSLAYLSILKNGITLFGQAIELGRQYVLGKYSKITCDNGYIYCVICYGVIYLIYFLYVIYKISKKELSMYDNLMLIIMGLYMIIENRFIDFPTSLPLIVVFHKYFNSESRSIRAVYRCFQEKGK